jgi:hypothetical protein
MVMELFIQFYWGAVIKIFGHHADHLPAYTGRVKNVWSYTSALHV